MENIIIPLKVLPTSVFVQMNYKKNHQKNNTPKLPKNRTLRKQSEMPLVD